jgi:hypothetical protein
MIEKPLTDQHYRVVRYYPHPGHGLMTEVLAEHISIDEAKLVCEQNAPDVSDEQVVIQDELKVGIEAEVEV